MAENKRTPRNKETRDNEARASDAWVPPALLPAPNPQPGWEFRYIRTGSQGNSDGMNVSQKFREGWVPVLATEVPEIQIMTDVNSRFPENIEVGGLLLCKMPTEKFMARREYFEKMAHSQIEAVDTGFYRENDSRMPLLQPERKTRTEFGRG